MDARRGWTAQVSDLGSRQQLWTWAAAALLIAGPLSHGPSLTDIRPTDQTHWMPSPAMGSFMENSGQLPNAAVRFYLASSRLHIGFAESSVSFVVLGPAPRPRPESWDGTPDLSNLPRPSPPQATLVRLTFDGSNRVVPEGVGELAHRSHFFLGNDASKWRTDVRSYREVVYRDLYPGINLVYRVTVRGLKYEFRVASGTDAAAIRASFEVVETLP